MISTNSWSTTVASAAGNTYTINNYYSIGCWDDSTYFGTPPTFEFLSEHFLIFLLGTW